MTKHSSVLIMGIQWPPETFLLRLIEGLSKSGYPICLATKNCPPSDWLARFKISWYRCPSWDVPYFQRAINFLLILLSFVFANPDRARKVFSVVLRSRGVKERIYSFYGVAPLANIKSDIVYFPWVLAADRYLDWFQTIQVPIIVSLRGSMVNIDPLVPISGEHVQLALRRVFEHSAAIHCVSQDILVEALKYGLDPKKAIVIRPAVDPEYFAPLKDKQSNVRFTVITTGSLIWRKGYEYSLLAIRTLVDSGVDVEFHIIGDGPERARILYTIDDLNLQKHVFLHGKLPPVDVRNRLQKADVFLLSSLSEGISNALLEAMSCGLPVVTTSCGGMREAVDDRVEGIIVPPRNSRDAANALAKLGTNKTLRMKMGNAGRNRVKKEFDIGSQIDSWNNLFQRVNPKK